MMQKDIVQAVVVQGRNLGTVSHYQGYKSMTKRVHHTGVPVSAIILLIQFVSGISTCQLNLRPFILWADPPYSAGTDEPTATPLPRTFHGLIDITLVNGGSSGIERTWAQNQDPLELELLPSAGTIVVGQPYNMQLSRQSDTTATFVLPPQTVEPDVRNSLELGYYLNSTSPNFVPVAASLNGVLCDITLTYLPSNNLPEWATKRAGSAGIESGLQPISLEDDQFIGVDGMPFNITGLNWFGFENGQTLFDGLWGGDGTDLASDVATVARRMFLLGFNTIRIPFSFDVRVCLSRTFHMHN
eukprot:jgi/Botrbrau1/19944/Bobra.0059s0061.1